MDQSPIGRTPRSNPATYTGVFDSIRKLFASTNEAKVRGYLPGRFSFNVKGGRCEACAGDGTIKIEMHFLPDVYVPCEVCKGARYNRDTAGHRVQGQEHRRRARHAGGRGGRVLRQPAVDRRYMETLMDVGLGYVRLGQPAPTLSGGEAQRVKLATELAKRSTGHTIYLLDEPTTGLHFDDVPPAAHRAVAARRPGQHRARHRAQPRRHQDRRLDHRPRPEGGSGGGRSSPRARPSTSPPSTPATPAATSASSAGDRKAAPVGDDRRRASTERSYVKSCEGRVRPAVAQALGELVEAALLVGGEAVHAVGRDLVEQGVELGLVVVAGRRPRRLGQRGDSRRPLRDVADHGPATTSPPPPRPRRRPALAAAPRRNGPAGSWGSTAGSGPGPCCGPSGRPRRSSRRAARSALSWRAQVLEDLDADDHGADRPRRDAEEEPDERVLGDEDQEHGQLDRPDAGLRDVEQRADDARDDRPAGAAGRRSGTGRAALRSPGRSTRRWRA